LYDKPSLYSSTEIECANFARQDAESGFPEALESNNVKRVSEYQFAGAAVFSNRIALASCAQRDLVSRKM
jgi:hypothetical protein